MSYSNPIDRKHGTIASSAADAMEWCSGGDAGTAVVVFYCTADANTTLHIRQAKTQAELDAPPESLHHELQADIVANVTLPVVVAHCSGLSYGRAWVAGGSGNYSLAASRRAHS